MGGGGTKPVYEKHDGQKMPYFIIFTLTVCEPRIWLLPVKTKQQYCESDPIRSTCNSLSLGEEWCQLFLRMRMISDIHWIGKVLLSFVIF